jgi:hypothetical protein
MRKVLARLSPLLFFVLVLAALLGGWPTSRGLGSVPVVAQLQPH